MVEVNNSSNVEAIDHDEAAGTVTVRFKGGATYTYQDVPVQDGRIIAATAPMEQISTGQLVNRFLKAPRLPYKRVQ